jgi:hypothetical protein
MSHWGERIGDYTSSDGSVHSQKPDVWKAKATHGGDAIRNGGCRSGRLMLAIGYRSGAVFHTPRISRLLSVNKLPNWEV